MASVYIPICHKDDLVIAQLGDVKVISIAFGKTTAKGIDIVLISAFAKTLSIDAFSTFKIFPLIGRIA